MDAVYVQGVYFKAKLATVVTWRPRGMETLSELPKQLVIGGFLLQALDFWREHVEQPVELQVISDSMTAISPK